MQIQANISQIKLQRSSNIETTALGVAILASQAIGLSQAIHLKKNKASKENIFEPENSHEKLKEYNKMLSMWKKAVKATMVFQEEDK